MSFLRRRFRDKLVAQGEIMSSAGAEGRFESNLSAISVAVVSLLASAFREQCRTMKAIAFAAYMFCADAAAAADHKFSNTASTAPGQWARPGPPGGVCIFHLIFGG